MLDRSERRVRDRIRRKKDKEIKKERIERGKERNGTRKIEGKDDRRINY